MKVAIYQGAGTLLGVNENLNRLEHLAKVARTQAAELLILPELYLTGYNLGNDVARLSEPKDGPSAQQAASIARRCGLALLYGYPERDEDRIYNSAVLIDSQGQQLVNYRKTHLCGREEKQIYSPGQEVAVASLGELIVGIVICYDLEFPELVRLVRLAGANFIAVPTALTPRYVEIPTTITRARAYENQVFVAYVNHSGEEQGRRYLGMSGIVAPDGKDIVRVGIDEETIVVATIDLSAYEESRRMNPYLTDRRPDIYGSISNAGKARCL